MKLQFGAWARSAGDEARRGRPTHFLRGATLHPPLTVAWADGLPVDKRVAPIDRDDGAQGAGQARLRRAGPGQSSRSDQLRGISIASDRAS